MHMFIMPLANKGVQHSDSKLVFQEMATFPNFTPLPPQKMAQLSLFWHQKKKKNGARTVGNGIHFLFYYVKIQNIIYYHHLFTQERAFCHQKIPTDRYNSRIKSVPAKAKFRFTEILCVS